VLTVRSWDRLTGRTMAEMSIAAVPQTPDLRLLRASRDSAAMA
jgi:hypothetical protein